MVLSIKSYVCFAKIEKEKRFYSKKKTSQPHLPVSSPSFPLARAHRKQPRSSQLQPAGPTCQHRHVRHSRADPARINGKKLPWRSRSSIRAIKPSPAPSYLYPSSSSSLCPHLLELVASRPHARTPGVLTLPPGRSSASDRCGHHHAFSSLSFTSSLICASF